MFPYPFSFLKSGVAVDEAYSFKYDIDPADPDVIVYGPTLGTVVFNYDIDWGDGTTDTSVVANDQTHTYLAGPGGIGGVGGIYTVKITGVFPGLAMYRATVARRAQLVSFLNWGINPIKSLYGAFYYCTNMTYEATDAPNLSELDVAPVSSGNAQQMFNACSSITELDLSGWTNTDKITSLYFSFNTLSALTLLNLTDWDVSNVTRADQCFRSIGTAGAGCEVIMPGLDWSGATHANGLLQLFVSTKFSTAPDFSNWNFRATGNARLEYCFYVCDGAFALDLSSWTNTGSGTNLAHFLRSTEFTSVNMTGWDTSNCTDFQYMFAASTNLTHVTGLNDFDSSSAGSLKFMFQGTSNFTFGAHGSTTNFDDVKWGDNLGGATSMYQTFDAAGGGVNLPPDLSNWDVSGVTTAYKAFFASHWTAPVDFSNWDFSGLTVSTGLQYFFYDQEGTTVVDFTNADIPSTITNMSFMFPYSEVESVTWGAGCDFSNVTTFQNNCTTANVTSYEFNATADFSSLANATNFLNGAQEMGGAGGTANYDNFLVRMDATNSAVPGTLTMGASTYSAAPSAAATAHANLVTAGWTISDGGPI